MAKCKCRECGRMFNINQARAEYDSYFDSLKYDDNYDPDICGKCAIADSEGLMNHGEAIFMMNGDADYDDDFVTRWL